MLCTNCQTPFDWTSGLELTNVVVHNPHYFQYLQNANAGVVPRNPQDILCGGMPDMYKFRGFTATVLLDKDLNKFVTSNVYNIYRFIGHIRQSMRQNINQEFESTIENIRIRFIISRITELEFKEKIYKAYTIKNKRVVNNRLLETVHVVSVDLIQRYFKIYDTTHQTAEMSYENTYKLMQEFCAIIQYFNDLQEEKTKLFKEAGIRITIHNYDLFSKDEILPFSKDTCPILNFNLLGYLL